MTSITVVDWFNGSIGRFTSHWIKLRKTYIARYADKVFSSLHEYFPVSEKGVIQSVTQTARKKKSKYSL